MALEVLQGSSTPRQLTIDTDGAENICYVYINEPPAGASTSDEGRIITVRQASTTTPAAAVAPGGTGTIGSPRWLFEPGARNLAHSKLDAAHQVDLNGGHPSPGSRTFHSAPEIQFKTSTAGTDRYQVSIEGTADRVRIEVWKRVKYRYIQVQRHGSSDVNSLTVTSTDFSHGDGALDAALAFFERHGIFFEPNAATTGGPTHGSTVLPPAGSDTLTLSQVRSLLGIAGAVPTRPEREIRLCAVGRFGGTTIGWGGGNLAAVACMDLEQQRAENVAHRGDYMAFVQSQRSSATPDAADGVGGSDSDGRTDTGFFTSWEQRRFTSALTQEQRTFYRELVTSMDRRHAHRLMVFQLYLVLVHELGHALGLVPSSGQAAGISHSSWHLSGPHAGHCRDTDCVMWWEVEEGNAICWRGRPSADPPFCRDRTLERCSCYLRACDLYDIRDYPN